MSFLTKGNVTIAFVKVLEGESVYQWYKWPRVEKILKKLEVAPYPVVYLYRDDLDEGNIPIITDYVHESKGRLDKNKVLTFTDCVCEFCRQFTQGTYMTREIEGFSLYPTEKCDILVEICGACWPEEDDEYDMMIADIKKNVV
jgi:hypothetical protein